MRNGTFDAQKTPRPEDGEPGDALGEGYFILRVCTRNLNRGRSPLPFLTAAAEASAGPEAAASALLALPGPRAVPLAAASAVPA